jgi:hypothetical protein
MSSSGTNLAQHPDPHRVVRIAEKTYLWPGQPNGLYRTGRGPDLQ